MKEPTTVLVLGAGASRGVSYAHLGEIPSPLDYDFFDLLQRLKPNAADKASVESVLDAVQLLAHEYRRSMERTFYTLQLRAYLSEKLGAHHEATDETIVADFARCIQALLRAAHGKNTCQYHSALVGRLHSRDSVISFNYDLVAERALRKPAEARAVGFGDWLYGFDEPPLIDDDLPRILKLHGSSNWRLSDNNFDVLTKDWKDFDKAPGYLGYKGQGTTFPIFLPFWDKHIEHEPWLSMWKAAFTCLRQADTLIVWGYSLPMTDVKAQQLFALAVRKKRFQLCIIDPSRATREKWRELAPDAQYWEYDSVQDFRKYPPNWWRSIK